MPRENWRNRNERIKREREKAEAENLCAEVVNEWAKDSWDDTTKYKICLRKLSPEAVQQDLKLCGLHFRQHRKLEAEEAERREERARREKEYERRERLQKVKDEQEEAILKELEKHGVVHAELQRPWNYRLREQGWTVQMPLSVLWKVIDVLPMLDPDDAVKVFEERERQAEAAKPKSAEAPF
jgi:hypothetical protein